MQELLPEIFMGSSLMIIRISTAIALVTLLAGFIFKAIGLFVMAKRKGLKNKWLCFVPFANFIIMGKLVGTTFVFRTKVNNLGVVIFILLLVSAVISFFINFGFYANEITILLTGQELQGFSGPLEFLNNLIIWTDVFTFYLSVIYFICEIMGIIFEYFLLRALFVKYDRKNGNLYSIIAILGYIFDLDILAGIFVFVCRNKVPIDFTQYRIRRPVQTTYERENMKENNNTYNTVEEDPFPEFKTEDTKMDYVKDEKGDNKDVDDDLFN